MVGAERGFNTLKVHKAYVGTFEDSVSNEFLIRLDPYPKMTAALEALPPKLLLLSSRDCRSRTPNPIGP